MCTAGGQYREWPHGVWFEAENGQHVAISTGFIGSSRTMCQISGSKHLLNTVCLSSAQTDLGTCHAGMRSV